MSSTTVSHTGEVRTARGPSRTVPFGRLATVELRKIADTRTALVLLTLLVLSAVAAMVVNAAYFTEDVQDVATSAALTLGLFLPVLGVVSVTNEWSKRTTLTTFALEPRRWRVLAAKAVAGTAVALATCVLMIAIAYPATMIAAAVRGVDAHLALDPAVLAGWTAVNILFTLCGIALGAMLLNGAAAIVVYFVATIAWGLLGLTGDLGSTLAGWLDLNVTTGPLDDGEMSGDDVGPLLASTGLWIVGPFLLGLLRVHRMELR